MTKPKLCEILGVEVNEEFVYRYTFYKVNGKGDVFKLDSYYGNEWIGIQNVPYEWLTNPQVIWRLRK